MVGSGVLNQEEELPNAVPKHRRNDDVYDAESGGRQSDGLAAEVDARSAAHNACLVANGGNERKNTSSFSLKNMLLPKPRTHLESSPECLEVPHVPTASSATSILSNPSILKKASRSFVKSTSFAKDQGVQKQPSLTKAHTRLKSELSNSKRQRIVEKQASQMMETGSLLNLVCECEESDENVNLLRTRLAEEFPVTDPLTGTKNYTYPRDEAGATLLHLAVLNCKKRFAEVFIEEFGEPLVNAQYQREDGAPGLYDGETALHIAIVNRSHKMVKKLLQAGADYTLRAVGEFFRPAEYGGVCYYGELPIMFAVSSGQQSMVKILMNAGASIIEQDRFHNTAQHFAVIHSLPRMYSYLSDILGKEWKPQKNVYGLSPMTLAVNLNKLSMFQHICAVQQRTVWKFGPVSCFEVPLEEFDTVDRKEHKSVLAIATELGHTDILQHAFVEKLLQWKWNKFASFHYYLTACSYTALMVALSVLVAIKRNTSSGALFDSAVMGCRLSYPDEPQAYMSCPDYDHSLGEGQVPLYAERSALIWTFEIIVLLGAIGFALLDLWDMLCFLIERWQQYSLSVSETGGLQSALSMQSSSSLRSSPSASSQRYTSDSSLSQKVSLFDCFSVQDDSSHQRTPQDNGKDTNLDDPTSLRSVPLAFQEEEQMMMPARRTFAGFHKFLAPRKIFLRKRKLASGSRAATHSSGPMAMHILLWAFAMLIVWHFLLFVTDWVPWEGYPPNFELALAVIFGYLYLLNFAVGMKGMGHLVVMIGVMIKTDFAEFLFVYFIILLAFSQPLYLIMVDEFTSTASGLPECEYCSIPSAATSFVRFTLGDLEFSPFRFHKHQGIVTVMYIVFAVVGHVLLVNLLIAMMGSTFSVIYKEAEAIWAHQRARHILLVERRLTRASRMKHRLGTRQPNGKYSFVYQAEIEIPEDVDGEEEADDFDPQLTKTMSIGGRQRRRKKFKAAAKLAGMFQQANQEVGGGMSSSQQALNGSRSLLHSFKHRRESAEMNGSMFRRPSFVDERNSAPMSRHASDDISQSDWTEDSDGEDGMGLLNALPPSSFQRMASLTISDSVRPF